METKKKQRRINFIIVRGIIAVPKIMMFFKIPTVDAMLFTLENKICIRDQHPVLVELQAIFSLYLGRIPGSRNGPIPGVPALCLNF